MSNLVLKTFSTNTTPFLDMISIEQGKNNLVIKKPNGDIEGEYEFYNTERNGLNLFYYPNNILALEQEFKNGILNGKYKEYYKNGNVMFSGCFENGFYSGSFELYNKSGNCKTISTADEVLDEEIKADNTFLTFPEGFNDIRGMTYFGENINRLKLTMRIYFDFYAEQLAKPTIFFDYHDLMNMYNSLATCEIKECITPILDDLKNLKRDVNDIENFCAKNQYLDKHISELTDILIKTKNIEEDIAYIR